MNAMELTLFMLLLGLAIWLTRVAFRSTPVTDRGAVVKQVDRSLYSKLPEVGKAGTAKIRDRQLIKERGLNGLKLSKLSAEQADILLNCSDYVDAVWARIPEKNGTVLSAEDREDALGVILEDDTYIERVMTWHQMKKAGAKFSIPKDACQAAVAHLLTERAQRVSQHS